MRGKIISVCLLIALDCFCPSTAFNNRPIIGILSQKVWGKNASYIAASYVKYIESAGARVVPILTNSTTDQLTNIFKSINGVLFPGGGASLNDSDFLRSGETLYKLAINAFDEGDYFPIWGTCLGFQMLCTIQHGSNDILSSFDADNYTIPLNLTDLDVTKSRLLSFYNATTLQWLTKEPLTMNNHQYGVRPQTFKESKNLNSFFQIFSTNVDRKGKQFVSTIEAHHYPIYGVQWHPEKDLFEWTTAEVMKHSYHAVRVTQTAANFFVQEARKSKHHFLSVEEERKSLVYNYNPVYMIKQSSFEQIYEFPCC